MFTVSRKLGNPPLRNAVSNGSGLATLALSLANWATGLARAPCLPRTGTNLAAICGTCRGRVAYLARGSPVSARKQTNGPRRGRKSQRASFEWERRRHPAPEGIRAGPRSRWSPLIPVLSRGPGNGQWVRCVVATVASTVRGTCFNHQSITGRAPLRR